MGRKGAIPERWEDYKPVGEPIKGTRFIAFKVPLRPRVYDIAKEPAKETWLDYERLLELVPNLGLIIDLTFTFKYYQPSVFTEKGVEHFKIMFEGRKLPKPPQLKIFKDRVEDFLRENKDNDKLIGVHCTHGVNRTGFIICHHLITAMNMSPETAIHSFEAARGHPIERPIYTNFLKSIGTHGEMPLESPERELDLVSNDRNRDRDHGNDRRRDTRNHFFNRDYDDNDWRQAPRRNFNFSPMRRSRFNSTEERSRTSNPYQQRGSNYYEILSGDNTQHNRRDSDDDTIGKADSNRRYRNDSTQERSSESGFGWNRDNYPRYASRDESSRNRRSDVNYQRYDTRDERFNNGRNLDSYETYTPKVESSCNGRNDDDYTAYARSDRSSHTDNYQRYAPRDESYSNGRNDDNRRAYANDESSRDGRNQDNNQTYTRTNESYHNGNIQKYAPEDETAYRSLDRAYGPRPRFEMLPEFARRRGETIQIRPIRRERTSARYSPTK